MAVRVVFMGSPEFALPAFRSLANTHRIVGVVTQPDRPAGRGRIPRRSAVKRSALEMNLPLIQPASLRDPDALEVIKAWRPDLIVVAAFGQILRQGFLDLPRHGCLNVHASLLPRWRGAAPVQAALLAGDRETGVTIMRMDAGLDTGPIVSQRAVEVGAEETAGTLTETLAVIGAQLLEDTLPGYIAGKIIPQPQPSAGVTLAPALAKSQGRLDVAQPATELARRVRAFQPWPGTWIMVDEIRLGVSRAHAVLGESSMGARLVYQGLPALGTASGLLVLEEVQPEGKRVMPGGAFLAGFRNWIAKGGR